MATDSEKLTQILEKIKTLMSNDSIDASKKKAFITKYATKLIAANTQQSLLKSRFELEQQDLEEKCRKSTDEIFKLMKETEAKEEQCKQHALSMIQLNKTGQKMLEEEKKKFEIYQQKYDDLIAEVDGEYTFDEEDAVKVDEENKKLKEKAETIHKTIKDMDEDYKNKIESLRSECDVQDTSMKDRFNEVKEEFQKADDLKKKINSLKEEMVPLRLKTNMTQGKMTEYKGVLSTTNDSIKNYRLETLRIAKKVENLKNKQQKSADVHEGLRKAILRVFKENETLDQNLAAEKKKSSDLKAKANLAIMEFSKKKKELNK